MKYNILELIKSNDNVVKKDTAYVWLLMINDNYLPGIFTSVWSLSRTKPDSNTVVMVTDGVSDNSINILKKITDYVVKVEYIEYQTVPFKHKRQKELYSSWINKSFTKWQSLRLPFKKIIFLDGDTIVLDNIDHLFKLNAPGGVFSTYSLKPIGKIHNAYVEYYKRYNKKMIGTDGYLKHNTFLSNNLIKELFRVGAVPTVVASSILLKPSIIDFIKFIEMLSTNSFINKNTIMSGSDEQSIAYYYSVYENGPKVGWTLIHHIYNSTGFWFKDYYKDDVMRILHFFSDSKPWLLPVDGTKTYKNNDNNIVTEKFKDVVLWWALFIDGLSKNKLINKMYLFNQYYENNYKLVKKLVMEDNQEFIKEHFIDKLNVKSIKSVLDLVGKLNNSKI